jgi:putative transcriptional regulator
VSGSFKGRLLVATPALLDPNFARTVVLVLEHGEPGAVGVVLNRPTTTDLADPLPGWSRLAAEPAVVFVGGPVALGSAIGLGRVPAGPPVEGWAPVVAGLGTVDLSREPEEHGGSVDLVRVFTGYAGWSPGQLEGEIDEGAWIPLDARPDDALSTEPDELWRAVLRRQPGRLAWLANFPPDLSLN